MLHEASSVEAGTELQADVCIVGAGPVGISIARRLAGGGARVLLLESGGRQVEPPTADAVRGSSDGYSYYNQHDVRARGFGGTSLVWPLDEGVRMRPLDPIDFESRVGVPGSGWPIKHADLADYWDPACHLLGLTPGRWSPEGWAAPDRPLQNIGGQIETTIFKLGKRDFGGYLDALAAHPDVTVMLHATVTEFEQSDSGAVERVRITDGSGRRFSARARMFVLAASGIDNPRTLLNSRSRNPAGLGNGHDVVGRYFTDRLSVRTGHIELTDPASISRWGFYEIHRVDEHHVEGTLRVRDDVIRDERLLNCTFFTLARTTAFTAEAVRSLATLAKARGRTPRPEGTLGHLSNVVTGAPRLLAFAATRLGAGRSRSAPVLALRAQGEALPNPESRVTLTDGVDAFGTRRANIHWRHSDFDRMSIRRHQEILDGELRRAGIGRVVRKMGDEYPPALMEGNHHLMGTTRMHNDPRRGVVDRNCRIHETPNMYVAGTSVFPTIGCSNPTVTALALSLRLGDHLADRLDARATEVTPPRS